MVKKILIGLGIAFLVLIVLGIFGSLILVSLSGARQKVYQPSIAQPLSAPSVSEKGLPSLKGLPSPLDLAQERGVGEVTSETPSRMVIKTGTMNMVVKDIKNSAEKISQYAEEKGGWIVSSSITEREKTPSGRIVVRVPAEIFDEAIAYFRGLAERIDYEGVQGQDITEEYTDLQSRLRNLEATETQLLKIMERSGTITEVLNVQRELTNVRGQIEQTKGRIQYLEQSVKMATITVNLALSEELLPIPPAEKWRPKYVFRQAWRSFLITLRSISYLLIWLAVYSLILIPLAAIIWQVKKFWKKRKAVKIV